jgi:FKBP-type peptidyl-prolyl cis-trans isomerase
MKQILGIIVVIFLVSTSGDLSAQSGKKTSAKSKTLDVKASDSQPAQLKTSRDSLSYCIGMQIGKSLSRDSVDINSDLLKSAIDDVIKDRTKLLTDEQAGSVLQAFGAMMQEKNKVVQEAQAAELKKKGEVFKIEGEKFLTANKTKEGVLTTPSGLQYKIILPGNDKKPKSTDKVRVHYKGSFLDGKVFDSSIESKKPAEFPLTGVIKGWTEGLQLIGEGGKMILYVPAELGYGDDGYPPVIPPSTTLIFEIELLNIL